MKMTESEEYKPGDLSKLFGGEVKQEIMEKSSPSMDKNKESKVGLKQEVDVETELSQSLEKTKVETKRNPKKRVNKRGGKRAKEKKQRKLEREKMVVDDETPNADVKDEPVENGKHIKMETDSGQESDNDDSDGAPEEKSAKIEPPPESVSTASSVSGDNQSEKASRPRRDRGKGKRDEEENKRTVFVGNLPLDTEKSSLAEMFQEFGEIESIRFRSVVSSSAKLPKKAAFIKKKFHESAKCMNAYVKFVTPDAADSAQTKNNSVLHGRHLRVDVCSGKKDKYDNKHTIFVGNLPFEAEEEGLRSHFQDCGNIEGIRVVRDKFSAKTTGIAFVCFQDAPCIDLALKLDGENFLGRPLRVNRCAKKLKQKNKDKKNLRKDVGENKAFFKGQGKANRKIFNEQGDATQVKRGKPRKRSNANKEKTPSQLAKKENRRKRREAQRKGSLMT